ncbi:copper chaperone PCu(A)C [Exilibacterium tricleocarpae]|uniref:Copper chaperone PCu(A)C n=1 Tax=Exilibacterium tricleocarpae TaxID=2591008 RepID=A0A545T3D5_9GAMM|nr:copper chaperone PCu(A)C [Exilibacterium tricleocarpae]TQV71722.1 copper chaperone PCu(A)C [Exilibacterium tricleocarpae]
MRAGQLYERWSGLLLLCSLTLWAAPVLADVETDNTGVKNTGVKNVQVTKAYLRLPPPGSPVAAVFLHLRNTGAKPHQLIGARSKLAGKMEVHTHEHVDGMMRMRPVAQLQVPAYSEVELKPGGHHLMVFGLRGELKAGGVFPMTLLFAGDREVEVEAEIKRL